MGRKFASVLIIVMSAGPGTAVEAYVLVAGPHASSSSVTSQELYSTLQLSISLASPVVAQNGSVNFTIIVENLGPSTVTAPVTYAWHDPGNTSWSPPCSSTYYSFSIYRGDYGGFSSPPPSQMLLLTFPGPFMCPVITTTTFPHYYVFGPGQVVRHHFSYSEYYINSVSTGWTQVPFPAGTYTLYAQDMWGQFVSTTFEVA